MRGCGPSGNTPPYLALYTSRRSASHGWSDPAAQPTGVEKPNAHVLLHLAGRDLLPVMGDTRYHREPGPEAAAWKLKGDRDGRVRTRVAAFRVERVLLYPSSTAHAVPCFNRPCVLSQGTTDDQVPRPAVRPTTQGLSVPMTSPRLAILKQTQV